jgi:1-acyl-sn-glycerol-3-phosphate acyltransferase
MNALRSLLFALAFYPGTVLFVLAAYPVALAGREPLRAHTRRWAAFHRWCAAAILGIRTKVEGEVPKGAVLVAAKHQSMFETLEIVMLLDRPAVIMKRQLSEIPLFGKVTKMYGVIPIDRAGGATALRHMMRAAEEAIGEGRPIVIFPEGTRVAPGERPALQPGFAGLYRALKLPVVPLALDSGAVWPRRSFVKRPGTVTMRFGEAIAPGLKRDEIEGRVHEAINVLDA